MRESALRDRIAEALRAKGHDAVTEYNCDFGRADVAVLDGRRVVALIEVKMRDFVKAVGQLEVYRRGVYGTGAARTLLAVPESERENWSLRRLTKNAGLPVWFVPTEGPITETPFDPMPVPEPHECGCVDGVRFCATGTALWLKVGLAFRGRKAGSRSDDYFRALKEFGDHLPTPLDHKAGRAA